MSDEIEIKYRKARLCKGDIVMTIVGAGTGTVMMVPGVYDGSNITQTTARISIDPKNANPKYCLYYLESTYGKKQIYLNIKGAAQPGLNISDVERFKINLPPNHIQKKIASFLSSIDNKIEITSTQLEKTREFKKGLLQQMFV